MRPGSARRRSGRPARSDAPDRSAHARRAGQGCDGQDAGDLNNVRRGEPDRSRWMAKIEMLRRDAAPPRVQADDTPDLAPFRSGRGETDRLTDLLAFALATERGEPPTPEAVDRCRRE